MSCDPFFVGLSDPFVEDGPPENPPPPDEPAPIYFNGTGDTVITSFNLELGLTVVASTHSGVRNFVVWLKDSQSANVELFVNEIGAYDGSEPVGITSAGQHVLDIDADGDWTIAITQPREVNAPSRTSLLRISLKRSHLAMVRSSGTTASCRSWGSRRSMPRPQTQTVHRAELSGSRTVHETRSSWQHGLLSQSARLRSRRFLSSMSRSFIWTVHVQLLRSS